MPSHPVSAVAPAPPVVGGVVPPTHSAVGSPLPEVDEPVVGCRTVQIVRKPYAIMLTMVLLRALLQGESTQVTLNGCQGALCGFSSVITAYRG